MAESQYVENLRRELDDVRDQIKAILTGGQEHQIPGSHSIRHPNLRMLYRRESVLNGRLISFNGGRPWVDADFGGSNA